MVRRIVFITIGTLALAGSVVALQQTYPKMTTETALENDRVDVQRLNVVPGKWVGEHSHAGNQFVVVLKDTTTTFRQEGKEWEESRKAGEVFWLDAIKAHDHKQNDAGELLLITTK